MQNKQTIIVIISLVIVGALIALGVSSWNVNRSMMGQGKIAAQNVDRHFIEQMIPHHEGAIAMAEVALERSKRPEILSLSNAIIEAQTKEIDDMKVWYKEWFGSDVPVLSEGMMMGNHNMMHMDGMTGNLGELQTTSNFDLEFISQMIAHHEMAVMMAQMLANTTERPEMKELANNIMTSQSREIAMMRSWAKAWSASNE